MSWNQGGNTGGGVHPTVPFGQPGQQGYGGQQPPQQTQGNQGGMQAYNPQGQPVQAPQQGGQLPFTQPPQNQPPQPHPTVPYGQFPQQQDQGPQQQPRSNVAQMSDDTILDGPSVPAELRGRTFGQVKGIYTALANDWLTRQRNGQQPQGGPAQQPGGMVRNQEPQGQPPQQTSQGNGRSFWTNPEESIGRLVEERVGTILQPVLQQSQGNAVAQARQVAMQQIRDFGELEGHIMQKIGHMNPQALSNPEVWLNAARLVRGELMERGQYQPRNQNQGGGQFPQQNGQMPQYNSGNSVPAQPHQFFTEGPTPPQLGELGGGSLSPQEQFVAQQMGMKPEEYMMWKGGVNR